MTDLDIKLSIPQKDEIEITTIGVGSRSGESIVVHLGNNNWAIIDSCKIEDTVLPLYYLEKIGVNLENVKIIVCSHWHEDHIAGMSEIIKQCPNADFYIAKVGNRQNFLRYVITRNIKNDDKSNGKNWREFTNCLKILNEEKKRLRYASIDTILHSDVYSTLCAISPSLQVLDDFDDFLVKFNPENPDGDFSIKANMCSIALILSTNNHHIILGSDLECNRSSSTLDSLFCDQNCQQKKEYGWCNALIDSKLYNRYISYDYIKVPHHSSITGFCPKKWRNHIKKDCIATSTVYINNAGVSLPQKEMLKHYLTFTKHYYLTALKATKSRDNNGKTVLEQEKHNIIEKITILPDNIGIICSRMDNNDLTWRTYLFGTALQVTPEIIKQYY